MNSLSSPSRRISPKSGTKVVRFHIGRNIQHMILLRGLLDGAMSISSSPTVSFPSHCWDGLAIGLLTRVCITLSTSSSLDTLYGEGWWRLGYSVIILHQEGMGRMRSPNNVRYVSDIIIAINASNIFIVSIVSNMSNVSNIFIAINDKEFIIINCVFSVDNIFIVSSVSNISNFSSMIKVM